MSKACIGRTHSKETKDKMSKAKLGVEFTDERKLNISKSLLGENNPRFGKPAPNRGVSSSDETKQKLREYMLGRKRGPYKKKVKPSQP